MDCIKCGVCPVWSVSSVVLLFPCSFLFPSFCFLPLLSPFSIFSSFPLLYFTFFFSLFFPFFLSSFSPAPFSVFFLFPPFHFSLLKFLFSFFLLFPPTPPFSLFLHLSVNHISKKRTHRPTQHNHTNLKKTIK